MRSKKKNSIPAGVVPATPFELITAWSKKKNLPPSAKERFAEMRQDALDEWREENPIDFSPFFNS